MSWAAGLSFVHGNSFLHRLNPIPKIVIVLGLLVLSIYVFQSIAYLLILLTFTIVLVTAAHQLKRWWGTMKMAMVVALVIGLLDYVFLGNALFSVAMGLRFIVVVSAFSVFSLTTAPEDVAGVMLTMGFPYALTVAFMMSIRFLPLLAQEAQNIIDAQSARGFDMSTHNPIKMVKNYVPILVPLIVISLMKADSAGQALETRGFGYTKDVTSYNDVKPSAVDLVLVIITCIITGYLVYLKLIGLGFGV
ncbi:MAG TPA: energy-coupling factor transporter transmembrane protein EcfT [Thermoprotei archaeon]|nr:energy-coupling factor transporter transmembrane protein EcfT [Thermoprotei archaeon]